ncbi:MAG: sigma-54-dependent Fis family transcriptional regulator [Magnetococcales bacterium]|nr:sigma-54-dependent Fis family transcriptional regulator [Magnetococcales bacterium]MBF0115562.1 sigma-54-dependent Fis family transcriptional regulator [Magnetococcales bacterium]
MDRPDSLQNYSILLVDDDESVLLGAQYLLESHGIQPVATIQDPRQVLPWLAEHSVDCVVLDLIMPYISGQNLLPQIIHTHPNIPVIVMTASQDLENAISLMKEGAFDFLVKPVDENRFIMTMRRAIEVVSLRYQVIALRDTLLGARLRQPEVFSAIITRSRKMGAIFQYLEAIAGKSEPILITGETGVGKDLIAQSIHSLSKKPGKLVAVNVASLDDNMFSDTLFGHVRGAFTGAEKDREGMIAQAAGGTLFLDEIGDITPVSQVKLLRLLENGTYFPLGSDLSKMSQARIVAATNQNLRQLMARGQFRQDLYFRLSSHPVEIPPLRQRQEDIPLLVSHFLTEANGDSEKPPPRIPPELLSLLSIHPFPGNIRELRAMVFNALAQHRVGSVLSLETFRAAIQEHRSIPDLGHCETVEGSDQPLMDIPGRFPTLREADHFLVQEAMKRADHNQGIAATLLGISRQSLNYRLNSRKKGES